MPATLIVMARVFVLFKTCGCNFMTFPVNYITLGLRRGFKHRARRARTAVPRVQTPTPRSHSSVSERLSVLQLPLSKEFIKSLVTPADLEKTQNIL